jgi:hypothetical protein
MADIVRRNIEEIFDRHRDAINMALNEYSVHSTDDHIVLARAHAEKAVHAGSYVGLPQCDIINEVFRVRRMSDGLPAPKKHLLRPLLDEVRDFAASFKRDADQATAWQCEEVLIHADLQGIRR